MIVQEYFLEITQTDELGCTQAGPIGHSVIGAKEDRRDHGESQNRQPRKDHEEYGELVREYLVHFDHSLFVLSTT